MYLRNLGADIIRRREGVGEDDGEKGGEEVDDRH